MQAFFELQGTRTHILLILLQFKLPSSLLFAGPDL
jgi:hypothetical protein